MCVYYVRMHVCMYACMYVCVCAHVMIDIFLCKLLLWYLLTIYSDINTVKH